jgi:hypothetical protein
MVKRGVDNSPLLCYNTDTKPLNTGGNENAKETY